MAGYFNFFPTLNYANNLATNVIAKIKFDQSIQENFAVFYPYTIEQGERADQIAARYYGDPTLDWIIYLSNNILDPYYDWPKTTNEFNNYILSKYGSFEYAQSKIAFFRVNYGNSESIISTSTYENLATNLKRYYQPVIGKNDTIISYQRKQLNLAVETNKVLNLSVSTSNGTFVEGEMLFQGSNKGMIESSNSTYMVVSKVVGSFANGNVSGQQSSANAVISNVSLLNQAIPDSESSFWEAVDFYTYENELNESKFNIRILDRSYLNKILKDMSEIFK